MNYERLKNTFVYLYIRAFILEWFVNDFLSFFHFWTIRRIGLKAVGMRIGKGSFIMRSNYFMNANLVSIGEYSHINRGCLIDGRGMITIGNSVSISHNVQLLTGSHDVQSIDFVGKFLPIQIDDYAWICAGSTILQGVHIGKGAVVAAGAVVTHDVEDYTIVGGIPAHKIGERNHNLNYHCQGWLPLT